LILVATKIVVMLMFVLVLLISGRHDTFPPLDLGLLHLNRSVMAVEFMVQAASITDGMTGFIAPPERSDSSPAILTCYNNVGGGYGAARVSVAMIQKTPCAVMTAVPFLLESELRRF